MTDAAVRQRGEQIVAVLIRALQNGQAPPFEWVVEHVGPDGSLAGVWAGATALQLVTLIEFARRPPRERVAAAAFGPRLTLAVLAADAPAESSTLSTALEAYAARSFDPALVSAADQLTTTRRRVAAVPAARAAVVLTARAVRMARMAWTRKSAAFDAIYLAEYAIGTVTAERSCQNVYAQGYADVSLAARRDADATIADQIRVAIAPPRLVDVLPRVAKGRAKT